MVTKVQVKLEAFLRRFSVQLLVGWMTLLAVGLTAPPVAFAQDVPAGWESYSSRPSIESVAPASHDLGPMWRSLKAAHFSYVAELLGLYPDDAQIYFLARDGELLFDTARLMTKGTDRYERMHLLNVSSMNVGDPNLRAYLEQNGITNESLAGGHDFVLVDTGFKGSIPKAIGALFTPSLRTNLKTQLIVCETGEFPSARAFLAHVDPHTNVRNPRQLRGLLAGSYEHLPRYTDRSIKFIDIDGRLEPLSPVNESGKGNDGAVSKIQSLQMMEDIKADWQKPETRVRARNEQRQIELLANLFAEDSDHARHVLKAMVAAQPAGYERILIEAQIRDLLEARAQLKLETSISLADIGIGLAPSSPNLNREKRDKVLSEHPEWALLFRSPSTSFPLLVQTGDWVKVEGLIRANIDNYTNQILREALLTGPPSAKNEEMQSLLQSVAPKQNMCSNAAK